MYAVLVQDPEVAVCNRGVDPRIPRAELVIPVQAWVRPPVGTACTWISELAYFMIDPKSETKLFGRNLGPLPPWKGCRSRTVAHHADCKIEDLY